MRLGATFLIALVIAGCATTYIKPSTVQNPAPAGRFAAFSRFEVQPVSLSSAYSGNDANQRAAARIQEHFNERVTPIADGWNRSAAKEQTARTLVIEPRIEHIKFIGGAARFWVGPLAGSSAVIMKVKYIDKSSGRLVAEPEFFQRAAAMSGAATLGGQDNAMLARIVTLVAEYTQRNYQQAVGGPSGAPEELVNSSN